MKGRLVHLFFTWFFLSQLKLILGIHLSQETIRRIAIGGSQSHHRAKRQAIVNPQFFRPPAHPDGQQATLNVPLPTTIGFFPNVGGRMHQDKCPRDKILMEDGSCQYLMTTANCQLSEEVILDYDSGKGICVERLCPPDRIFIFSTQLCHDPLDMMICPPGRELFYSAYGTPVCACPDGTIESDDDLDDDVCEELLTKTLPCSSQGHNLVRWLTNFNSMPQCTPDPCGGLNLVPYRKNELPFLPSASYHGQGQCHRWGQSDGVCQGNMYFALDIENQKGECSSLEEAGYEVRDNKTIKYLEAEYGELIDRSKLPPAPATHGQGHIGGQYNNGINGGANVFEANGGLLSSRVISGPGINGVGPKDKEIVNNNRIQSPSGPALGGFNANIGSSTFRGDKLQGKADPNTPLADGHISKTGSSSGINSHAGVDLPQVGQGVSVNLEPSKVGQDFQVNRGSVRFRGNIGSLNQIKPSSVSPTFQFNQAFNGDRGNTNDHLGGSVIQHNQKGQLVGFDRNENVQQQQNEQFGGSFNQGSQNGQFGASVNQGNQDDQFGGFSRQGNQQDQFGAAVNQGNQDEQFGGFSRQDNQQDQFGTTLNQGNQNTQFGGTFNQGNQNNQFSGSFRNQGFRVASQAIRGGFNRQPTGHRPANEFPQNFGNQNHQFGSLNFDQLGPLQSAQSNQSNNQFNSPEIFDPNAPISIEVLDPFGFVNSVEFMEPYGMQVGRSLGTRNPPVEARLATHVTILPSGERVVHRMPRGRRIRSIADAEVPFGESYFKSFYDLDRTILSRKKRQTLPFASPSNVFETRLLGCRPGAVRDINAKCRNTILPARVPKRRGIRAAPPVPPTPSCQAGFARDIRRRCVQRNTAQQSVFAKNLG